MSASDVNTVCLRVPSMNQQQQQQIEQQFVSVRFKWSLNFVAISFAKKNGRKQEKHTEMRQLNIFEKEVVDLKCP